MSLRELVDDPAAVPILVLAAALVLLSLGYLVARR